MKIWFFISIAVLALVTGACTPMFMVGKGEEKGAFLGSNSNSMYEMLCASGDLQQVLDATQLSKEMKDTIYKYNCSAERSRDKIRQLYASMTVEERKDLKNAFRKNKYSINYLLC